MRITFVSYGLITSVLLWGIWFGGQLFYALWVVPMWSASPPESIAAFVNVAHAVPAYNAFSPLYLLVCAAATAVAWPTAQRSRRWLLGAVFCGIVASAVLLYMTPLTIELFEHSQGDGMSATRLDSAIHWWKSLNWLRVIAEFAGFLAATVGLRKWAAEAALVHPPHPSREPLL